MQSMVMQDPESEVGTGNAIDFKASGKASRMIDCGDGS
jgi:hypothetical protein